jgi:phospholipid/cholesterol/gamma-HCH transport system substrate-binding protein
VRERETRRYRRAGVVALVLFAVITAAVFLKQNPFASGYHVHALFSSAAQLHTGGEVRIAGIKVGQVTAIDRGPNDTANVTMRVGGGRPIHTDATFAIKPRLVLEGNAYVDVDPGTPGAPELRSGATVAEAQTSVAVQLDQVLDVLDLPTRNSLQRSLAELARGFGGSPSGAAGLRRSVRELSGALGSVTEVARAARGTRPGDLGRAIGSSADVATQIVRDPNALAAIVTDYRVVSGALADENRSLSASIAGFDDVVRAAPPTLTAIDAALPKLTRFANELRPALRSAPATLGATNRLLDQIGGIVGPAELPALLRGLSPVARDLPGLETELRTLFRWTKPVTDCISSNVVPTLDMKIQDGVNSTGDPVYLDLVHLFTGLTAFSSSVDGNGGTVRLGVTTGDRIINGILPGLGQVIAKIPGANGVRPTWLGFGVNPPYRPDQPCGQQALPNLSARSGPVPTWLTTAKPVKGAG